MVTETRLRMDMEAIFGGLTRVGPVTSRTGNAVAIHEADGPVEHYLHDERNAMVRGRHIDTRLIPKHFVHALGSATSLRFLDAHGDAMQTIETREETYGETWRALVASLATDDHAFDPEPAPPPAPLHPEPDTVRDALAEDWRGMVDVLQIGPILKRHGVRRDQALGLLGDMAWALPHHALDTLLQDAVETGVPLMCFVGSRGCIQIHSGPLAETSRDGDTLHAAAPHFRLRVATHRLASLWAVRKPVRRPDAAGHVTSVEGFDAEGNLALQFFGTRRPGHDERSEWRDLVEGLPR